MKTTLLLLLLVGSFAQARVLHSDITKIKGSTPTGLIGGADNAQANIDLSARTMKLEFYKGTKWVSTYETGLDSVHEGVCNTVTYQGAVPMDSARVEILVSDNKHFGDHCVSYFPVPTTGVTLEITSTFFDSVYTYRMEGTELAEKAQP